MNANERYEKLAEQFKQDTGLLAPGKDEPAAVGNDPQYNQEYRQQEWDKWIKKNEMLEIREEALLTDDEIGQVISQCDYEDSKVSCPIPITPNRYETAVAQAQLDKALKTKVYKDYTIKDLVERGVIVADNQTLPYHREENLNDHMLYFEAQQDMLKPNSKGEVFIRVFPKEGG